MKKQRGFTLIELLVTIAIIGLLAAIVFVSLNNARAKARDTKRMADLKQIANALELYYDKYGFYPTGSGCHGASFADSLSGGDNWIALTEFMPKIPKDPSNTSSDACPETWDPNELVFIYMNNGQHYELLAPLERSDNRYRCDKNCWKSTVHQPGDSWCKGESNQCSDPIFADPRGQHIYVIGN